MVCFKSIFSLKSLLLTDFPGLQYILCNATKKEVVTKFLKGALKHTQNFQEVIYSDLQTCKLQLSALCDFKTHEITSTADFLSLEAGANGFSTE